MNVTVQLGSTWPVLAPALGALFVLLVDVVRPRLGLPGLVLAGVALAAGAAAAGPGTRQARGDAEAAFCLDTGPCLYRAGPLASGLQLLALGAAAVVLSLAWSQWRRVLGGSAVPVALFLAATAGVTAVPAAGDLGTLLIALELATLPVVGLVALEQRVGRVRVATGGAVALLTTSLVSFALLALGAGLWVLATGTGLLDGEAARAAVAEPRVASLLTLGAVLIVAGLGYKLSAAPFHAWTPVTYAAAPLPVTLYLAGVSKVAALGALVVLVLAVAPAVTGTGVAIGLLAALSMTLGNALALRQDDTVRLLAWSAVAQAGWVLLPLTALSARAVQAAGGYLAVYVVATLLAFTVVAGVAHGGAGTALAAHRALLHRRPLAAAGLGLALLTLAGLPPAVVGLVAKVVALRPVASDGTWLLALVAALNVALGIAVYLRWAAVAAARPAATEGPGTGEQAATAEPVPEAPWPWPHRVVSTGLSLLLVLGSIAPVGIW